MDEDEPPFTEADREAVRRAQARIDKWAERERRGEPHPPWTVVRKPDGGAAIFELPTSSSN
jgi:hypothetical protein